MKQISYKIIFVILIIIAIITLQLIHSKNIKLYKKDSETVDKYKILIMVDEKKLYLFKNNQYIKFYPIATGTYDTPSPIGQWRIIGKDTWGEGFGGRWLGLNVCWGTYGIHGTLNEESIGWDASHGCIRMYRKDIRELYDILPVGTIVIIQNGTYGPFGYGLRDLMYGDTGADVQAVQRRLKQLGYYTAKEDGIYGSIMERALNNFQSDNNLPIKNFISYDDYKTLGIVLFE